MRDRDIAEKLAADRPSPQVGFAEAASCEAERQKYWSELKEHERIDRTRSYVKRLEERLDLAERFIRALVEHKHDASGAIAGPFDMQRYLPKYGHAIMKDGEQRNPDDIYF